MQHLPLCTGSTLPSGLECLSFLGEALEVWLFMAASSKAHEGGGCGSFRGTKLLSPGSNLHCNDLCLYPFFRYGS